MITFEPLPIILNQLNLYRLIGQNGMFLSITRTTWYLFNFQKLINLVLRRLLLHVVRILLSFVEIALEVLFVARKLL